MHSIRDNGNFITNGPEQNRSLILLKSPPPFPPSIKKVLPPAACQRRVYIIAVKRFNAFASASNFLLSPEDNLRPFSQILLLFFSRSDEYVQVDNAARPARPP